jgi:hypothetical protein
LAIINTMDRTAMTKIAITIIKPKLSMILLLSF